MNMVNFNLNEDYDEGDKFICHEHGTKKTILSPRREYNPWPPRYRLGDLTTKLQETCSELGHFSRFVCENISCILLGSEMQD